MKLCEKQSKSYFKREEFACSCGCGFNAVDIELLAVLTDLREHFGKPVYIKNHTNRCKQHNERIRICVKHGCFYGDNCKICGSHVEQRSSKKSQHMNGIASDPTVKDVSSELVYKYLDSKYPHKYGIGLYDTWVHIDVREKRVRWDKREAHDED